MPLHTVEAARSSRRQEPPLPASGTDDGGWECLAASAGHGVWGLPSGSGGGGSMPRPMLQLAAAPCRGATCSSLSLDRASGTIAVSWRPPLSGSPVSAPAPARPLPCHSVMQQVRRYPPLGPILVPPLTRTLIHSCLQNAGAHLSSDPLTHDPEISPSHPLTLASNMSTRQSSLEPAPSAAGSSGRPFHEVRVLSGHTSALCMARGAFVAPPQSLLAASGHPGWFASAGAGPGDREERLHL